MQHVKPLPDRDLLHTLFRYEVDSGVLYWRIRPTIRSRRRIGDPVGTPRDDGYVQIRWKTVSYMAHRAIWKMETGVDPECEIDHRNGVRDDNRWANLRAATSSQQNMNKTTPNHHRGVHYLPKTGKYGAQIKARHVHLWLGCYDTPEEACAVYRAKALELHGEFHKPGQCSCPI